MLLLLRLVSFYGVACLTVTNREREVGGERWGVKSAFEAASGIEKQKSPKTITMVPGFGF